MRFASATTTNYRLEEAIQELTETVQRQMGATPIDVLWVFASTFFLPATIKIALRLNNTLAPHHTLGVTATGVIGEDTELEDVPAITIVAAHLPDVTITPFMLNGAALIETLENPAYFKRQISCDDADIIFLFADAFTTPIADVLAAFNRDYGGVPVVGGIASASSRIGGNALILGKQVVNVGAVGLALTGALDVDVIVSQGCRPIGDIMTVTDAQSNAIFALNGQPPATLIRDLYHNMPPDEQALFQESGIFLGRAMHHIDAITKGNHAPYPQGETPAMPDDCDDQLGRGDFLIRSVIGVERETGGLVVGDVVSLHERVQFHLRDTHAAEEDLELLLIPQQFRPQPIGGLLFSCNSRGSQLYHYPDGDIRRINQALGVIPLAGFFGNGELGPVGGHNFLHEYTASLVLFRPKA